MSKREKPVGVYVVPTANDATVIVKELQDESLTPNAISGEALQLKRDVQNALRDILSELSTISAAQRGSEWEGDVYVEEQDVIAAGKLILAELNEGVSSGRVPPGMSAWIDRLRIATEPIHATIAQVAPAASQSATAETE